MQTDWDDLKWRIGHFWLSRQQIVDNPDAAFSLFGKMIVMRCEHHFATDRFEYVAISPLFDQIVNYVMPPNYELEFNADTNEVRAIRLRRDNGI